MEQSDSKPQGSFAQADVQQWRATVEKGLRGADFDKKLVTQTLEGITVQPLYTEADFPAAGDPSGFAGAPPYRRGPLAVGRHGARWNLRTRHEQSDVAALKREIQEDLGRGANSLWLRLDAEARGLPADSSGASGVPCASAAQLGEILAEVPLERVGISLDAGGNALAAAACLLAVAQRRELDPSQLDLWLNADPLGALARDGALPHSLEDAQRQLVSLAHACSGRPATRAITISVAPYHDAGASAVEELGCALATGVEYLRWLTQSGLSLSDALSQLAFSVSVGPDFFMELAKLRALRQCWSAVTAHCGAEAADQNALIHASTSDRSTTRRDPWVNLLRETTEAFSAALGAADAITTAGFDRQSGAPGPLARRIATNTQTILNEEAHVTRVADPAGGSYYVESLTDQLVNAGWAFFQSIEAEGGMAAALAKGTVSGAIAEVAERRRREVAKRKRAITGLSEFANPDEDGLTPRTADATALETQRKAALAATQEASAELSALGESRSLEAAIAAAAAGASLSAITAALSSGAEPARTEPLGMRRHGADFERLRDLSEQAEARGEPKLVFSCNLGSIPEHKARAQYALGFFNAGGIRVTDNDGFADVAAAVAAFRESGASLTVICGSDPQYAEWVERLAPELTAAGATRIILAGRPGDAEARYREAGVTDFIYMGIDVVQILDSLLTAKGAA